MEKRMHAMRNHIPPNILKNFDVDLQQFYFDVISKEMDISEKYQAAAIMRALKKVVDAYRKETLKEHKSFIQYDTSAKRCAYLLKHGPCFTSAVAKYLLKAVQTNYEVVKQGLTKSKLSICCLGGGPASDAVAVIKIIRGLYLPIWNRTKKTLKLTVSVIDLSKDWWITGDNLLKCLEVTQELVGVKEVKIAYKFYTADLTKKIGTEILKVIRNADLVTMVYFLSAVNGSEAEEQSQSMLEVVMFNMKRGSLLFYLDSAAEQHYQVLNKAAMKNQTMLEIYGPLTEELHTLSIDSVKKFIDLYSKYLYKFVCMNNTFLSVSSWYKPFKPVYCETNINSSLWVKPTKEESDFLTEKMMKYRKLIQKTIDTRFKVREHNKIPRITQNSEKISSDSRYF